MDTEEQTKVAKPAGVTRAKYSNRVVLKTILGRSDGGLGLVGERVVIGGWVRSSKEETKEPLPPPSPRAAEGVGETGPKDVSCVEILQSRIPFIRSILKVVCGGNYHVRENLEQAVPRPPPTSIAFLQVGDGSCVASLQVVVASAIAPTIQLLPTGTCILVEGILVQPSVLGKHVIELKVEKILHIGTVEHEKYPLSKKRLPFEMLRDYSQFRPRTTTDAMSCADDFFKFLCKWVLDNCSEDMKFVSKRIDKTSIDRLQSMISSKAEKICYTEAVDVLGKVANKKFEIKLEWGDALTAEHLSYLVEEIYKKPIMIYNYPKEVKPFYARLNDDGKTVAAFDMVLPKARILLSGSQSEERLDFLCSRIKELGLPREQYEWYLDLRRHGTVEHSGFSLRFDHMVLFATGLTDVRDVIPFPRSYAKANN